MNSAFMRSLEIEMQRQAVFELALLLVAFIVTCWVSYWVIKCAIRDGIRESGLVGNWQQTATNAKEPSGLPEIKH